MYDDGSGLDWCQYTGCRFGGILNGVIDPVGDGTGLVALLTLTGCAAVVVGVQWLLGRLR